MLLNHKRKRFLSCFSCFASAILFLPFFLLLGLVLNVNTIDARVFYENESYYVEQKLGEQWNLIAGISFNDIHKSSYLTKEAIFKSYYYDAKTGKDIEIRPDYKAGNVDSLILYSNAFWVFSAKPGKIVYKASPSFVNKSRVGGYYKFYKGNNLIAINEEMYGKSLDEIKGNCSILEASYWDAGKQNWTILNVNAKLNFKSKDELTGLGIRIKVAGDCGFFGVSGGFNGIVSIATLKDNYLTGEVIGLTDPPENPPEEKKNIDYPPFSFSAEQNGYNFLNYYRSDAGNIIISDPRGVSHIYNSNTGQVISQFINDSRSIKNFDNVPKGYIIQLKENPVVEEKKNFEDKAEKNERLIQEHPVSTTLTLYRVFALREKDVENKIKEHEKRIEKEHNNFKNRLNKLAESGKITGNAISQDNEEKEIKVMSEYKSVFNGIALDVSRQEAEEIKKLPEVDKVYPNVKVELSLMDSVPLIQNRISAGRLDSDGNDCIISGKECLTGKGVRVGIIDTGIDHTHKDLGGCFGLNCKVVGGYDFSDEDNDPMDYYGHGTHVAATVAGNGTLNGVAPEASLYSLKVFPNSYEDVIIEAIEWSIDPNNDTNFSDHLDIISLSLGGSGNPDDPMSQAIDNAVSQGVVAVIAAGNSGPFENSIGSPGTARKAITVGASDKNDSITSFSSRGPIKWKNSNNITIFLNKPDIVAPGANICAAQYDSAWEDRKCYDDSHVSISGTSMATPHVSGAVALIKQAHPDWTPEEMKYYLMNNAKSLGQFWSVQGNGRLNLNLSSKDIAIVSIDEIKLKNPLQIYGKIIIENFSSYKLYIKEKYGSSIFVMSSGSLIKPLLGEQDLGLLPDGEYIVVLNASNIFGKSYIAESEFTLEKYFIISPKKNAVLNNKDKHPIILKTNVLGLNLEISNITLGRINYEWDENIQNESNKGIVFLDEDNKIGEIDSFLYSEGLYKLKVYYRYKNNSGYFSVNIYFDKDLRSGWPKNVADTSTDLGGGISVALSMINQPTIYDINNDDKKEIIISYGENTYLEKDNAKIYAFSHDGKQIENFPVVLPLSWVQNGPIAGDFDGDTVSEILTPEGYLIRADGSFKRYMSSFFSPLFTSDVENNGIKEIYGSNFWSNQAYLFNNKFEPYSENWPIKVNLPYPDRIYDGAIEGFVDRTFTYDLNDDGTKEILVYAVIGVWHSIGDGWYRLSVLNSSIYAFDLEGNTILGWPKNYNETFFYQLQTDWDEDNSLEMICINLKTGEDKMNVTFFSMVPGNGEIKKKFEFEFLNNNESRLDFYSLNVGDIDGKRKIILNGREIYRSSNSNWWNIRGSFNLLVDSDGNKEEIKVPGQFWNSQFYPIGSLSSSENMNFDVGMKYGMFNDSGTWIFTGSTEYFFNSGGASSFIAGMSGIDLPGGKIISDIDGDGKNEVIGVDWTGNVYVWNTNGQNLEKEWGEIFYDAQHTNCYKCNEIRPQSKIVNLGSENVSGNVTIKIQKKINNVWQDYSVVYNKHKTIVPQEVVKLDALFNPRGYSINETGEYRVYVEFSGKKASWGFKVSS
jgi:subtilisin family serine protease